MTAILKNGLLCAASLGTICASVSRLEHRDSRLSFGQGVFILGLGVIFFVSLERLCEKFLCETKVGSYYFRQKNLKYSDAIEVANK